MKDANLDIPCLQGLQLFDLISPLTSIINNRLLALITSTYTFRDIVTTRYLC